jgi:hypothetical protein
MLSTLYNVRAEHMAHKPQEMIIIPSSAQYWCLTVVSLHFYFLELIILHLVHERFPHFQMLYELFSLALLNKVPLIKELKQMLEFLSIQEL